MKRIASNELKEFLQDWLNWAERRESKYEYRKDVGLCSNSIKYDITCACQCELRYFLKDAHPFGCSNYYSRLIGATQHQDPNRLAWVRAALNDTLDTWKLME